MAKICSEIHFLQLSNLIKAEFVYLDACLYPEYTVLKTKKNITKEEAIAIQMYDRFSSGAAKNRILQKKRTFYFCQN